MACFADMNFSQGSIATYARCDGIINIHLSANLLRNLPLNFLQSFKISQNYGHASVAALFWRTVFIVDASQKRRLVTGEWLHGRKRHTSRGQR